jgi:hypothetical protein
MPCHSPHSPLPQRGLIERREAPPLPASTSSTRRSRRRSSIPGGRRARRPIPEASRSSCPPASPSASSALRQRPTVAGSSPAKRRPSHPPAPPLPARWTLGPHLGGVVGAQLGGVAHRAILGDRQPAGMRSRGQSARGEFILHKYWSVAVLAALHLRRGGSWPHASPQPTAGPRSAHNACSDTCSVPASIEHIGCCVRTPALPLNMRRSV